MTRYIDETDVYKLVEPRGIAKVHCSQIDELPRADVVPKSEVEMLQAEAECLKNANADLALALLYECEPTKEHLHILEATVREKVAREIFEEIEKIRLNEIKRCEVMREKEYTHAQRNYWEGGEHSLRQLSYWIAELKKKYI